MNSVVDEICLNRIWMNGLDVFVGENLDGSILWMMYLLLELHFHWNVVEVEELLELLDEFNSIDVDFYLIEFYILFVVKSFFLLQYSLILLLLLKYCIL